MKYPGQAKVQRAALDFLARRAHSAAELRQKLIRKGHPDELVQVVLAQLQAAGLQSDAEFVATARRQALSRGQGPLKLCYQMAQKGVDATMIASMVDPCANAWLGACQQALRKKLGGCALTYAAQPALARFLNQRGFTHAQIKQVMTYGMDDESTT